jgi:hypothetical protein
MLIVLAQKSHALAKETGIEGRHCDEQVIL